MPVPIPTPIYRIIHIDNLEICLRRGGLYTPNHEPDDGLKYRTIHNAEIQNIRHNKPIYCGPCGFIHDYVPFYFGYLSPMLLQLKTGQVLGYNEGQDPLIYLVSTVQSVIADGAAFVFTDGHCIAFNTNWYDNIDDLEKVDWNMVYERYWAADYNNDIDRQRRKQAEFLIYKSCRWSWIQEIGVIDTSIKNRVEGILANFANPMNPVVQVRRNWFYS